MSPPCGTENELRTTTSQCTTCPEPPPHVGIGITTPEATLDVKGKLKLDDDGDLPIAGMIRWNDVTQDFEGYDGTNWRSFTKPSTSWGNLPKDVLIEKQKSIASDGAINDWFGSSVSISGDYAIIGAEADNMGSNTSQGSAYIFHRSGTSWTEQAKLTASDGAADDLFGSSVSIAGDYAIIGAFNDDIGSNPNQGSAYIFHRSGTSWAEQAKLTANDGAADDLFGSSVSISGDYAIIGASRDDPGNLEQGSAYIFLRLGTFWIEQAKLTASDGETLDRFGISVSISGDYAIIGAYLDEIGSNAGQGSAYIFHRSGTLWTEHAKLTASDGEANDLFGFSVSISGDYVIIGALYDDLGSNVNKGSVYFFNQ